MSDFKGKILGTVVSVALILLLIYLIFFPAAQIREGKIEMVQVTGNELLDKAEYLDFTKLRDSAETAEISLPFIKDRFEKHPYVKSAEVELLGKKEAKVRITEKGIMAMVLIKSEPFFLSDDFQLLPMIPNTKSVTVPVISNPGTEKNLRPMSYMETENIVQAFKIIDAVKMTSQNLSSSLSEINLRNGGDIILHFSDLDAPVIFGRNGTAAKMVYLEMLWDKNINGKSLVENSEYVDLRFANEIFIGSTEKTGLL